MKDGLYLTGEQREFLVPKAYNAAVKAGEVIMEDYQKGDYTSVNQRAQATIKNYLGSTHIPLLSEEGREMRYDERKDWDMFWLVDPLDGTKEFIKGNNEFTVNIALMLNHRPVVGVIYVPYYRKIYFCEKGSGSYMREGVKPGEIGYGDMFADAVKLPLVDKRNTPLRIAVSRSHQTRETAAYVDIMRKRFPDAEIIEQGSSYKFCLLAEGAVDYYVRTSDTYEWDTAAGEIILSDTGGTTKSLPKLGKFDYNKESLLNPWFECKSGLFAE